MLTVLIGMWSLSAEAKPPVVDDTARYEAQQVSAMADSDPTSRMLMLLAAQQFSDGALFALAGTHPGLVEQLTDDRYRVAIDYIARLPPGELYRVRAGETVVRTAASMTDSERRRIDAIVEGMGYKAKKFQAVRIGPLEGRVYRFEVTVLGKRKQRTSESIELAWPATPERDERSREALSKHFGARPSQQTATTIQLVDGSFENPSAIGQSWALTTGVQLGLDFPTNDVNIDAGVAIDGARSLRFHASEKTRHFRSVAQVVEIPGGTTVRVRTQVRADNLRVEFQQKPDTVYLRVAVLDGYGQQLSETIKPARLGSHPWEPLEISTMTDPSAESIYIELLSAVSGTAWFDGVSVEIR